MIHRYAAGSLTLIIAALAVLAVTRRGRRMIGLPFAAALLVIVLFQASLGMLTVTLRLTPLIVTLHLIFGMTTLALLGWLWLSVTRSAGAPAPAQERLLQRLCLAALMVLALQIALGGWTSSNYAALACPDFPTCQGSWWPPSDYAHAFVLLAECRPQLRGRHACGAGARGHSADTPAGRLCRDAHARAGGGPGAAPCPCASPARAAWAVLAFLALQLIIAVSMIEAGFPLWLGTAHNAGAALLLLATVALYEAVRSPPPAGAGSRG